MRRNTPGTMEEATYLSYNNAIVELRANEYPMLQGECVESLVRTYAD
jgi:hypothetical protein